MALVDKQTQAQLRAENRRAARITRLYGQAYKRLRPYEQAVMATINGASSGRMTGREIVESEAFKALIEATTEELNRFGAALYEDLVKGARDATAAGAADALALILESAHPDDRERAASMLQTVDQQDLQARLGVRA